MLVDKLCVASLFYVDMVAGRNGHGLTYEVNYYPISRIATERQEFRINVAVRSHNNSDIFKELFSIMT